MWLLDTTTMRLKEFIVYPPRYAILSHTWGHDEVTFADIHNLEAASKKQGFAKIKGCCAKALADGLNWAWVDTCCIDKSSSSELSEAINSMFKWYATSHVCYVFLADVDSCITDEDVLNWHDAGNDSSHILHRFITASRWFTRGWTLQELIAPKNLEFYSAGWVFLGMKSSLEGLIESRTGIPLGVLRGNAMAEYSAFERMSWASGRQTTRDEDVAYCLLGLFEINMPLLYGEGDRAFTRLQEEILRRSDDMSILCWSTPFMPDAHSKTGVLSSSPKNFSTMSVYRYDCNDNLLGLRPRKPAGISQFGFGYDSSEPLALTGRGILVTLLVREVFEESLLAYTFTRAYFSEDGASRMGHICVVLKPNSYGGGFSLQRDMTRPLVYVYTEDLHSFSPKRAILDTQTIRISKTSARPTELALRINDKHAFHTIIAHTGARTHKKSSNGASILIFYFGPASLRIACQDASGAGTNRSQVVSNVHLKVVKRVDFQEGFILAAMLAHDDEDMPLQSQREQNYKTLQYLRLHCGHCIMFKVNERANEHSLWIEGEIRIF